MSEPNREDIYHKSHRDEGFDEEIRSPHLWCLHCERTYDRGKWRVVGQYQMCPYADCSGDAVLDAFDWAIVRDGHPEYPDVPVAGTRYPQ